MTVYVDDRWGGTNGIGRYASEVTSRLSVDWMPLSLEGSPSAPADPFRMLPPEARESVVYSPGYNVFLRSRRQLVTVHDLIHLQQPGLKRHVHAAYYNTFVRRAIRRDGMVITDSEASVRAIRDWLADDTVEIINAGIGCSSSFNVEGRSAEADEPYLFYVGNIRPHKNLATALRALALVEGVQLRAVMPAGEAQLALALVDELGIGGRVTLLHGLGDEELAAEYRGALATLMPSTIEGFGLPPLESIMCGTPVLWWEGCTVVGETVGARGIGIREAHDARAWADAVRQMMRAPVRVSPPAPDEYSWDRTADVVSDALRRLIDVA